MEAPTSSCRTTRRAEAIDALGELDEEELARQSKGRWGRALIKSRPTDGDLVDLKGPCVIYVFKCAASIQHQVRIDDDTDVLTTHAVNALNPDFDGGPL